MKTARPQPGSVKLLETLRDEIRLQIHLAGMEAKTEWLELEPEIEEAVGDAAHDAGALAHVLVARLLRLRGKLAA